MFKLAIWLGYRHYSSHYFQRASYETWTHSKKATEEVSYLLQDKQQIYKNKLCTKALSNYFTYEISLPNAQSPAHRLCSATHRFYSFSPYFRAQSVNNNCSPSSPLLSSLSLSFSLYPSHSILLTLSISFSWNCVFHEITFFYKKKLFKSWMKHSQYFSIKIGFVQ